MKFPFLDTESNFPNIENVEVYDYDNDFDYSRYNYSQMNIMMCRVPWDVGEAHIGNRTIGGIGNVVHFGSEEKRDAWFDAIPDSECYRKETKYRQLHRDNAIMLELPFDVVARYNYICVSYNLFANDGSPVFGEDESGLRKWFWFIREVEFIAPNTTKVHLLIDAWQTFIYSMDITSMLLERGHAPVAASSVREYLNNPLENSSYLLAPDVDFGEATVSRSETDIIFNAGEMLAVIVSTANPAGDFGAKADNDWTTPSGHRMQDGAPSYYAFACTAGDIDDLISAMDAQHPQFMQTIKAAFFASTRLVTQGGAFTFCGIACNWVASNYTASTIYSLTPDDFGYETQYAGLAKLYTSPYAHIEITDENGNVSIIKVEDTAGVLTLRSCINLAFPWISIDSHVDGIGKATARNLSFKLATNRNMPVAGSWYQVLFTHHIPCYGVTQSGAAHNDYATHYDRLQRAADIETRYSDEIASAATTKTNADASADMMKTNADASADTSKTNADASADTSKTNADEMADCLTDNAALQVVANNVAVQASIDRANADSTQTQAFNSSMSALAITQTGNMATSTIAADQQQANISAASAMAKSAVSSISSLAGLDIGGAISAGFNGAIDTSATYANLTVGVGLTQVQAGYHALYTDAQKNLANTDTAVKTTIANTMVNAQKAAANDLTTSTAANSSNAQKANATRNQTTQKANAGRDQATGKANAGRTQTTDKANNARNYDTSAANAQRDRANAQNAIANQIRQAGIGAPQEFGTWANGEHGTTRPQGVFAQIVTESDAAIAQAGDEFLRYGYRLERQWPFDGNWVPCKHFCFWKIRDIWVKGLSVPDAYVDRLRLLLFEGVTIWKRPEDIGTIGIYENGL